MKNRTTLIDHAIRVKLKLNCLEYCLLDFIYNNPSDDYKSCCDYLFISVDHFRTIVTSLNQAGRNFIILSPTKYIVTDKWKNEFKKNTSIEEKAEAFRGSVDTFITKYPGQLLTDFFNYWSELNKKKTKMRWEMEPTWDLNKRLIRWANNNKGKTIIPEKDKVTYIIK